jgi:hypothetical protein
MQMALEDGKTMLITCLILIDNRQQKAPPAKLSGVGLRIDGG